MQRIDAHHHLWRYTAEEFGWIDDGMASLRRDFLLNDLRRELQSARVDATVAVQARQAIEETEWLLSLASSEFSDSSDSSDSKGSPIAGVVGWLPIASQGFEALLERFTAQPALKGLRHVVQGEPIGFLDGEAFHRGIQALRGSGLVYDLLIFAPQLAEATRFVDRHPNQPFVLDHIAKPVIREGKIRQWAADIRELARREQVSCKLSGMVTEADPTRWSAGELAPYFDVVLEAFGPERLMIGTDWPVLTVGCTYAEWWKTVERWIAPLSASEQANVLGGTAARVYGLSSGNEAKSTPVEVEAAA